MDGPLFARPNIGPNKQIGVKMITCIMLNFYYDKCVGRQGIHPNNDKHVVRKLISK